MSASNPQPAKGLVALVTGAASGIGEATALRLAADGARVALADTNEAGMERVAEAVARGGGRALVLRLDVASEPEWRIAMRRILTEWGRLDACVNAAGVAYAAPIVDLELAEWHRVLAVNLDGVFLGTKHAFRAMRDGGGGSIVNIASVAGIEPYVANAVYGTGKAAGRFFTRIAALEGVPLGIRVNSVSPAGVATPMWKATPLWPAAIEASEGLEAALRALVRDHGFATPQEIAATVAFLIGPEASLVTGRDFSTEDILSRRPLP
ncbi:MAG: SDR family oxidoreductase [Verrucomicrobiales bacterium]|nr:SDR family oxidoreductase [Verrucomicrobiales bacterium]